MLLSDTSVPGLTDEIRRCLKEWGIAEFTEIQALALQAGVAEGQSQIVCSPTSSGKTLVGEIAILAALRRGCRCLYLVSHKALADQKYFDFSGRLGETAFTPLATVGLSTGDRDEGDISPQLLVATYEKALSLLLSGQFEATASVIVADEFQILGDDSRGPNIETLCAIFRQQRVDQFVALTATVGNAQELADWLECVLVTSPARDIELHQEIWNSNSAYGVRFGQEQGEICHVGQVLPTDPIEVVRHLVSMARGPVLVFTESRNEATELATRYSQTRVRTAEGIALAQKLELFSEPTESSEQLQQNAQKRVAFHTADLTAQERQVIESGFVDASFDVCFATSTLAAGVNFPFRSVVFPKLTYQWGERQGTMILRSDYRNMSGRAGRLGFHSEGFAVLLPRSQRELSHANNIVLPDNDNVDSQLVRLSMRRTVLALVSFRVVSTREELTDFFRNSFYWHQIRERNPKKLDNVIDAAVRSTDWLMQHNLIEEDFGSILPTPVGKAVAQSGLLPITAINFLDMITQKAGIIDVEFDRYIPGLIHWVCNCGEFASDLPSRFLPWPVGRAPVHSTAFLQAQPLLAPLDRTGDKTNQCAHALVLFCKGDSERIIRRETNIPSGQLHRLAIDVAWVFEGLRKVVSVPSLQYSQTLTNKLSMLARQIQWGAPPEALDILRVAQREDVPGFGRQRAVALLQQGIQTFDELLTSAREKLSSILGNERRTTALLTAVASCLGVRPDRFRKAHRDLANKIGQADVFDACTENLGTDYEVAIRRLLESQPKWSVHVVDDGKQQNVPDLLVSLGTQSVLIECKTTTKNPPLIKKEEAFAVLQKAVDFDKQIHRLTLGKPGFDEHSKKKAQSAADITLIEHDIFMEGMLRLLTNTISPEEFLGWLTIPGLTELERLGGKASYEILRAL